VYEAIRSLKDMPHRGRTGLFFPPAPYVAVYRVKEQSIEILRVYHSANDGRHVERTLLRIEGGGK
jgi:plasmid stabilization system protein ParE